jgi:putative ABC transport system permease protein
MKIFKLVLKNSLRHKLRTFLTILGIAIAVIAFNVMQTVVSAWYIGVEASSPNRLIARQAISFIFPLPLAYRDKIAQIDGIEEVTYANWFQGVYIDKDQFFARLAVDVETIFKVYPEYVISEEELATFKKERNSCVIGLDIAKRYDLKIGDVMNIEGDIYPGNWDFVVKGIYYPRDKTTDATQMFFHWTYLDERMKAEMPGRDGNVGWYVIKISDPSQSAAVSKQVDMLFKNSLAETKTETESAFQQSFIQSSGAILTSMNVISFVIIGIIMLVLGNTMIMAARERTREYAVLKTLGFSAFHLTGLITGESLLISAIGGGLGLILTFPIVVGFAEFMPKGWFPIFEIQTMTIVIAVFSALLIGILASIFPIQKALRTAIVDGFRFVG